MRYFIRFIALFQLLLAIPAAAQQWEPFSIPNDPKTDVGILRTAQQNVYVVAFDGLYRSKDEGIHWQQIRQYTAQDGYRFFEINRENNQLYYTQGLDSAGYHTLYTSQNLGDSWTSIGNIQAWVTAFVGDTLYGPAFSAETEIWRKWGNEPWAPVANWPKDASGKVYSVKASGKELWVAAAKGIYHSPDAGYSWEFLYPLDNLPPAGSIERINLEILHGEVLVVNEYADKVYYSKDQGASWQESGWDGLDLTNSGVHLYATNLAGTELLRFEGGGADSWTKIPLFAQQEIELDGAGEINGTVWLGSEFFGVLRKPADAPKWQLANGDMLVDDGENIRYFDGHLFEDNQAETFSADNGLTWLETLNTTFPDQAWQNGNYNYQLAIAGNGSVILRCPRNGRFEWEVYRTLPEVTEYMAASGDTLLGVSYQPPYKLFQSFNNGQSFNTFPTAFENAKFKSSKGKFYLTKDKTLYRSDNAGVSWQPVYTFPFDMTPSTSRFYIVHDTLLISYVQEDQIFYSIDQGQSFNLLPAPQNATTTSYRLRAANDMLLLMMDDGFLYISQNVGKTWISTPMETGGPVWGAIAYDSWGFGNQTLFTNAQLKLRLDDKRQVTGKVFLDVNSNGQFDAGDKGLNGYLIKAAQNGALANTYNAGDFTMLLGTGADALSVTNVPANFSVAPASVTIPAGANSIPTVRFAIKPVGPVNDAGVTLTAANAFKAGYDNALYVNVKNAGTVSSSGQLKLALNPLLTVLSASPAADAKIGDTLVWNYTNLTALSNWQVRVDVRTAVVAPGAPVALRAQVLNAADVATANNMALLNEQVVASFDPNDKTVSEAHVPVNEADGEALVYTIRFQNLGNTATDFITVRDTLSDALDATTVQVLSSSHPFDWRLEEGRVLVFRFNPIQLTPVTEDTLRSQGFVKFLARLKSGLEVGDEIANTAHIYFDFNPAIITNTVVTDIAVVSTFEPGRQVKMLEIFPNPASGFTSLQLPESETAQGQVDLFSTDGKLVYSAKAQGGTHTLDVQNVRAGVYWCRWSTAQFSYWGKVSVQR